MVLQPAGRIMLFFCGTVPHNSTICIYLHRLNFGPSTDQLILFSWPRVQASVEVAPEPAVMGEAESAECWLVTWETLMAVSDHIRGFFFFFKQGANTSNILQNILCFRCFSRFLQTLQTVFADLLVAFLHLFKELYLNFSLLSRYDNPAWTEPLPGVLAGLHAFADRLVF